MIVIIMFLYLFSKGLITGKKLLRGLIRMKIQNCIKLMQLKTFIKTNANVYSQMSDSHKIYVRM